MSKTILLTIIGLLTVGLSVAQPDLSYKRRHFDKDKLEDRRNNRRYDYSGPVMHSNPNVVSSETKSDGTIIERYRNGSEIERRTDGTIIERQNNGSTIERRTDGVIIRNKEGITIEQHPDGTIVRHESDGTVYTQEPDGSIMEKRTDGTVHRWSPDGAEPSSADAPDFTPSERDFKIDPPKIDPPEIKEAPWLKPVLIIVGILVVALITFLIVRNVSGRNKEEAEEGELSDDELVENIHEMDFETMIANLIAERKYRRVVRLLYLQSLKELSDRNLINWEVNKTNWDYYYELKKSKVRDPFQDITMIFEYVWYGHMPMDDQQFEQIHQHFKTFNRSI